MMTDTTVNPFIGCWKLISCLGQCGNKASYPLGENPYGMLIYTENKMMAFIASIDRPPFSTEDIRAVPPEEIVADFSRFETYCGSYTIDFINNIITHSVENSKLPNHIGASLSRYFHFGHQILTLQSTKSLLINGKEWQLKLVWSRVNGETL